jgi:ribonuclease-3
MTKTRETVALEKALDHKFENPELLERALTHSSYARELRDHAHADGDPMDNEQFEFIGDSVLAFVTSQELVKRFPHFQEGELSKLRAYLVSARHLVQPARNLDLGKYLRLGRGEERSGGRNKSAILVDALEAVIAAIYQDGGLRAAHKFILREILRPELRRIELEHGDELPVTDYKSALQEQAHAAGRRRVVYALVKEEGPEHRKTFTIEARVFGNSTEEPEFVGRAEGPTKKRAEQTAARHALQYVESLGQEKATPQAKKSAGTPKPALSE